MGLCRVVTDGEEGALLSALRGYRVFPSGSRWYVDANPWGEGDSGVGAG